MRRQMPWPKRERPTYSSDLCHDMETQKEKYLEPLENGCKTKLYNFGKAPRDRDRLRNSMPNMPKFIEDLLNKVWRTVKLILGLLTVPCRLQKYMSKPGLIENAMCRIC